ncbi:MAG: ATP-binding protein [Agathobacter sp.]
MRRKKVLIRFTAAMALFMICIILAVGLSQYWNRNRNLEHVDQFINELSNNTAKHVSDVFDDKCDAIDSIAYLYGKAMQSKEVDSELLAALEKNGSFDWIRFVAADGTDYTSDGSIANVQDREYFLQGMSGKSGICEVLVSRISGEKLIGFYAPVYFEDEICGIMVGFLSESTISTILDTSLYDYLANTYIVRQDGAVLGRNMAEASFDMKELSEGIGFVDSVYRESVVSAVQRQEHCKFTFQGTADQSIGYVVPITGTDWSLIQIFPSEATSIVMKSTQKDAVKSLGMLLTIFLGFIGYITISYRKYEKEKSKEYAYNKVNALMRCVSEDYVYLIDVDLSTQREVRYKLYSSEGITDWSEGQDGYSHCIREFADQYVADYDRERFLKATELTVLLEVLRKQNAFYIEYDAVVNGETLQFQGKFTISGDNQFKNHMLISIRNITESTKERNEKEKELAEARRMAESSSKAKTTFLFNMSHDIRTPMNAIIGYTNLLENHFDDKEKLQNYTGKIKTASNFLLSLINNVLEMARIESGKMQLDETLWNVEQFNDTLISVFEEQFKEKNISFTREIQITHPDVFCDALKLKQIYLNILSNAIKYTPEGGSVSMTLHELPSEKEGYAMYQCRITDTGIGMSEEFLAQIFDEFTREASATESRIVGSGLGMSIVKKLVEFMGGSIEVKSHLGEGTTFTVTIPHRIADRSSLESMKNNVLDYSEEIFKQKRILLAEDNDMNAEIAMELLGSVGFTVERAEDGIICVHMVQEAPEDYYDIILMDIQMPNMNGYDATKKIRRLDGKKSKLPIIAMTANAFEEDKKNALDAGMDAHIGKPIEIPKLMETLSSFFKQEEKVGHE